MEKCLYCKAEAAKEWVELLSEPFEGRVLEYGTRYMGCGKCKVTWYNREQMREQIANRTRALEGR